MIYGDVPDDELGKGVQVFIDSGHVLDRSLPYRMRVTCTGGINKYQVCFIEQAVLIGNDLKRGIVRWLRTVREHTHWPDRAHLQPDSRRAWTAVVEKGHRA